MSNVSIVRLSTGEDVIATVTNENVDTMTLKLPFVIIPTQTAPGQPVQLMMTPYMPYAEGEEVMINQDKIVTKVKPKKDILGAYQQNTSKILTPNKSLITETKLPTFDNNK